MRRSKRFDAVDPILDPAEYSISNYVSDPMMLVQYLYVVDNPICSTDPLGLLGRIRIKLGSRKAVRCGRISQAKSRGM